MAAGNGHAGSCLKPPTGQEPPALVVNGQELPELVVNGQEDLPPLNVTDQEDLPPLNANSQGNLSSALSVKSGQEDPPARVVNGHEDLPPVKAGQEFRMINGQHLPPIRSALRPVKADQEAMRWTTRLTRDLAAGNAE